MKIRAGGLEPQPYPLRLGDNRQLPQHEQAIAVIRPATLAEHQEIQASTGRMRFDLDAEAGTGEADVVGLETRVRGETIRRQVVEVRNLETEDGEQITTADQLLRLISDLPASESAACFRDLYQACTSRNHLEAAIKNG